ncbi:MULTISPECIES: hypothetical protein [unclassified Pseudoalteromonas]|uniref:hypothetical protein n=1 Tax=unclassified Pseudoalteromonas TaxID=194690 RepID=UPI0006D5FD78|nr:MULTISPECIES: hypothetical protein [unclassified Pseudoalteromonas]KPV97162.1 hypothetical protein AN214_01179 [Pseudoalteromonas sp. P1-9]MCF6456615.1 hypothetical protein [Pseudoalteromonas sp. MMG024]
MDLVQSLFNYAWQIVVYLFLLWLVYYFFTNTSRTTKVSVTIASALIIAVGVSTGMLESQFNNIDAASEQHIKHIKAIQETYDS